MEKSNKEVLSYNTKMLGSEVHVIKNGGWKGTNTDVEGFLLPLGDKDAFRGQKAVVIGCGGSARAVVAGLQTLKLSSIHLIGRRTESLHEFINDLQLEEAPLTFSLDQDKNLTKLLRNADIIINTTPIAK